MDAQTWTFYQDPSCSSSLTPGNECTHGKMHLWRDWAARSLELEPVRGFAFAD